MSPERAHIAMPMLRPARICAGAVVLGIAVLALAGCGDALEVQPVSEDEPEVVADPPAEVDPAELAQAHAVLEKVPNGVATPLDGGILFGGSADGGRGESFGFASGPPATSSSGFGFGNSSGGGGGSFGSSNADTTAGEGLSAAGDAVGEAAAAAASAGSGLVDSGRDAIGGAAAAARSAGGSGGSFGFRSDGGGEAGSSGARADGGAPAPVPARPGPSLGGDGRSFGYRVDRPQVTSPRGFGYAGPPRAPDRPADGTTAAPAADRPAAPGEGAVPVIVSGIPLDVALPGASATAPRPRPDAAAASSAEPAAAAARARLWGCAPARRPDALPRLRVLSAARSGLTSVAFLCLPAGVRQEFNGWRSRPGVVRVTQTADAGDVYEVPMALARRAGAGLPTNVLAAHPELGAVPEAVTAFAGFTGQQATTSRLLRRPVATMAEVSPAALARVHPADLDRLGPAAWARFPAGDLRKLPAVRWSQLSAGTVSAVPPARRAQLSPEARRALAIRGL